MPDQKRYHLLEQINLPDDLKKFDSQRLPELCGEIRQFLVDNVSKTGGHLASNLGVVELTVALHRLFESPIDQFVWDVGHQSYTHKILTGRRHQFHTLRQEGGISGFPKTKESLHDAFMSGHSSTSIAVADGLARAKQIKGEQGHVIAVIGDGAFTGGMAYEGLNNAAQSGARLIIILNDNKMSISKNVGSISGYLARLRTNRSYFGLKDFTKSVLRSIPLVGDTVEKVVSDSKSTIKNLVYSSSLFEELGFVHMGPVDGHDLEMLTAVLGRAKSLNVPVFIHVETQKGRGYRLAEQNPGAYHGVSSFNPKVGSEQLKAGDNFSECFGKTLTAFALKDERICAVTAAMKYATGLNYFSKTFRATGRFVDVGIAEQHAVAFCAALSAGGMIPVFAVYSSFLQRAYDQVLHDCSIEQRHVVFAVDRAGFVGEDGETHHGLFDCAYLSTIPHIAIYSPATYRELRYCLKKALYIEKGVVALRYPRGSQASIPEAFAQVTGDYAYTPGAGILLVTYGRQIAEVSAACELLKADGMEPGILKLTKVFPINPDALEIAAEYHHIVFAEEGIRTGGIGGHFLSMLVQNGFKGGFTHCAADDFIPQGTVYSQLRAAGLDRVSISAVVRNINEGNSLR